MNWTPITSVNQLEEILEASNANESAVGIFKHSTRCSISSMAKYRFERSWDQGSEELPVYYLDIIAHRNISNHLADILGVRHESPQFLMIRSGKCIYHASHMGISVDSIKSYIAA